MKLVEFNWNPGDRQLRQFGLISLLALPLLGWLWGGSSAVIGTLAAVGAAMLLAGWTAPRLLKPVYLGLSLIAMPIGLLISELLLWLVYFGLFLPIGLLFRAIGRDRLQRQLDRTAPSYWQAKPQPAGAASYYRQS